MLGCVQVPQEVNKSQNQIAVTSVRGSSITYPQGSLFSLSPKYVKETSLKAEQTQVIYRFYTSAIIDNLESHSFKSINTAVGTVFHVNFGIALSNDLTDAEMNKQFGVTPGLPEQNDLTKGSFLISIEDSATGVKVWRGVVQGFAHEDLAREERKQRVAAIVNQVLTQFYISNNNL